MRKSLAIILVLVMLLIMSIGLASCGNKAEEAAQEDTEITADASVEDEDAAAEEDMIEESADIVKTIEPDSEEELGNDLPLQIESVVLYKDGTVSITPTDDLKKNELNGSEAESLMPFAESGEVKDLYLCRIGNGGYRTIVALMEDGTVSAINTRALIEDHIIAVMDNLGGRDSFTGIEQIEDEDGFGIAGKTEEGDDIILDPVILSEDEEPQQVEQAE